MLPLKDYFDINSLKYLKDNLDKITKENIENAIKEKSNKCLEKFENKIVLVQPDINFVKIYKFGSIDRENYTCYYDFIEFIYNEKSIQSNIANNILISNFNSFNFNPKYYTLLTEEEYNEYLDRFEVIKSDVRYTTLKTINIDGNGKQ